MRQRSNFTSRLLPLLVTLSLPGLAMAQYAPYAPPPPPPPPGYPPPPPPPPGYAPPPTYQQAPSYAQSQQSQGAGKVQLSAFAGWITSSDVSTAGGHLRIDSTNSWGAEAAFAGGPGTKIALKWIYYQPTVQFVSQSFAYSSSSKFNVATNYFLVAGEKGYRKGKVEPFFGGAIGAVVYAPDSFKMGAQSYNPGDTWYMAFGLAGGVKIFVAQKVALRLGIEMLAPVYFSGGGIYAGSGGAGMAVTGGVPTVSGNFTAGLTFSP
jgi:hypothetical protein